MVLFKST